jgi:hypothetical protein
MPASRAGYRITADDRERYGRHRRAEVLKPQPGISEQGYIKAMQLPQAVPEKPGLWQGVESRVQSATEPTSVFHGAPTFQPTDPATGEMALNLIKRTGRVLFGIVDMGPQAFSALTDALSADPQKAQDGETRLLQMHPGAQVQSRVKELRDDYRRDPKLAVSNVGGDVAAMWIADRVVKAPESIRSLRQAVTERYGPRPVRLAGESVPLAVGEAEPQSRAGQLQTDLKRSGVKAGRFEALEREQQEAVKRVIRRTAQETSGLVGPIKAEPGAAMQDAASAVFTRARPMFTTIDNALRTMPASFRNVSTLVMDAIRRARRLGVVIDPEAEGSLVMDGKTIKRSENPELWQRLVDQGIINDSGQGTPLSAALKVRSELLKMQRASADATLRNAIGNEVRGLNEQIEGALKGGPLHDDWREANRLWAKGYALRDVADAITKSTKGTPAAIQAPGITPVPTKLQGAGLVARLNTLADDGILSRAFTPEEVSNLRQSAEILDRVQRVKVGKGQGEGVSISHGLRRALRGAPGPMTGAVAGGLLGGLHGAELGAVLGWVVQQIGERKLVDVMTKTDGVAALRAVEQAKTPATMRTAMRALAAAAAASGATRPQVKQLRELNDEARRRRPSVSAAP